MPTIQIFLIKDHRYKLQFKESIKITTDQDRTTDKSPENCQPQNSH